MPRSLLIMKHSYARSVQSRSGLPSVICKLFEKKKIIFLVIKFLYPQYP